MSRKGIRVTDSASRDPWGERLPRGLGLWSAVAVVIGSTIGSGIFRTPAGVAQRIDDVPLFLTAWVLGGVVAVCGALTYAELVLPFFLLAAAYGLEARDRREMARGGLWGFFAGAAAGTGFGFGLAGAGAAFGCCAG